MSTRLCFQPCLRNAIRSQLRSRFTPWMTLGSGLGTYPTNAAILASRCSGQSSNLLNGRSFSMAQWEIVKLLSNTSPVYTFITCAGGCRIDHLNVGGAILKGSSDQIRRCLLNWYRKRSCAFRFQLFHHGGNAWLTTKRSQ